MKKLLIALACALSLVSLNAQTPAPPSMSRTSTSTIQAPGGTSTAVTTHAVTTVATATPYPAHPIVTPHPTQPPYTPGSTTGVPTAPPMLTALPQASSEAGKHTQVILTWNPNPPQEAVRRYHVYQMVNGQRKKLGITQIVNFTVHHTHPGQHIYAVTADNGVEGPASTVTIHL